MGYLVVENQRIFVSRVHRKPQTFFFSFFRNENILQKLSNLRIVLLFFFFFTILASFFIVFSFTNANDSLDTES